MAGALRAVQRADRRRQAGDIARRAVPVAAAILATAAGAAALGGTAVAVTRLKTHLAERVAAKRAADAAEQLAAAGTRAAEREAARAAEEREWAAATEAERASAPDRTKRAIEVAAADEEREERARRTTLERRAVEDGAIEREAKEAARTEESARAYIERVTRRRAKLGDCTRTDLADGKAESIHDRRGSVGALLYLRGIYVGFAVPVVTREIHTTRVAYREAPKAPKAALRYDSYAWFAGVDAHPAPKDDLEPSRGELSAAFLRAMFVGDVCLDIAGVAADTIDSFVECGRRLAADHVTVSAFAWCNLENLNAYKAIPIVRGGSTSIESALAAERARTRAIPEFAMPELRCTLVVPVGYYDRAKKKGHSLAVLFHIEKDAALIAVADAGETAVAIDGKLAVVVFDVTTPAIAAERLELAIRAFWASYLGTEFIREPSDLEAFRGAMVDPSFSGVTELSTSGSASDPHSASAGDPHSAIRMLETCTRGLVSHEQQGGSCTYYGTFWLLGLASGIGSDEHSAVRLVPGKGVAVAVQALRARIEGLDRDLKRVALADLARSPDVEQTVACIYSRCPWLDTAAIRERRLAGWGLSKPVTTYTRHVGAATVAHDSRGMDALPTLASASAWIRALFAVGSKVASAPETALIFLVVFTERARGLLVAPMDVKGAYAPAVGDHRHVLAIAQFLCYVRSWLHPGEDAFAYSTADAMLVRCARYAVRIAQNSALLGRVARDEPAETALDVNARTFVTPLPWAAREYCSFLDEARDVMPLLFAVDSPYTRALADLGPADGAAATTGDAGEVVVLSANAALAAEKADAGTRADKTVLRDIRAIELGAIQERALSYLCTDPSVAVLNVVAGLLNARQARHIVESDLAGITRPSYVFGVSASAESTAMHVRFLSAVHTDAASYTLSGLYGMHDRIVPLLRGESREAMDRWFERMVGENAPHLYVSSRVGLAGAVAPTDGGSDGVESLSISIGPSRTSVEHDVDALVEWADFIRDNCAAYAGVSGAHALAAYTRPLSSKGPSSAGILALESLSRNGAWEHGGPLRALLCQEGTGEVDLKGAMDAPMSRAVRYAYLIVAVHRGHAEALLGCARGLRAPTDPVWSHARERTRRLISTGSESLSHGGRDFVFAVGPGEAGGPIGLIGHLHQRLLGAGCVFDHWLVGQSSLFELDGVTIAGDGSRLDLTLEGGKPDEPKPKEVEVMRVMTAVSEYWAPTYRAAVVPIVGTLSVATRLVVVPGGRPGGGPNGGGYPLAGEYVTVHTATGVVGADHERAMGHFAQKEPFVVELDGAGLLPVADTPTDKLVSLFVAYAYAGSMVGTRLVPLVASRMRGDETTRAMVRVLLYSAPCPLSFYAVCAASLTAYVECSDQLLGMLRCAPPDAHAELRAKMLTLHEPPRLPGLPGLPGKSAIGTKRPKEPKEPCGGLAEVAARVDRRARYSPTAQYGECERDLVRGTKNEGDRIDWYEHTDAWKTALEASTGRFVNEAQRDKIGEILETRDTREAPWLIVQMQMGFGKSSVVVPMLVARYLAVDEVRVVFVTQPAHLTAQAARTVGAFVGANPTLVPIYALNVSELRACLAHVFPQSMLVNRADAERFVVVLSTAEMQCLVRDHPRIYSRSRMIAHIADEVDVESDPLRCEVIIEGADPAPHYAPAVAKRIGVYYRAALELGSERRDARRDAMDALHALDAHSASRLEDMRRRVRELAHKVDFGLSDDAKTYIAVPYVFANTPSRVATLSDLDAAINALVVSIEEGGLRETDRALVRSDILSKFGADVGGRILGVLEMPGALDSRGDPPSGRRFGGFEEYYATQIAMPRLRVSKTETSVAFVDVLGCGSRFVGFSGTMGTSVPVPEYAKGDPRERYTRPRGGLVSLHSDAANNKEAQWHIERAEVTFVRGLRDKERSERILAAIVARIREIRLLDGAETPIFIVDGSGEFGAFDDHLESVRGAVAGLGGAAGLGHFDEEGVLVGKEHLVRYYSHRDSRGVDSTMGNTAWGLIVLSWRTRLSAGVQAAYRLRGLKDGQQLHLFVATDHDAGAGTHGKTRGRIVLDMLLANEQAYTDAAARHLVGQLAHASKPKVDSRSFEREVTCYARKSRHSGDSGGPLVLVQKQKTQEKMQERTRNEVAPGCYQMREDPSQYKTLDNEAQTEIAGSLRELGVSISPFLARYPDDATTRRRAFAIVESSSGSSGSSGPSGSSPKPPRLAIMSIAEVWTRQRSDTSAYIAYTHDGHVLRARGPRGPKPKKTAGAVVGVAHDGSPAPHTQRGLVLFGRYLCDGPLSVLEEHELLRHLRTYASDTKKKALRSVVSCLVRSGFLLRPRALLHRLADNDADSAIFPTTEDDVLTHIREEMLGGNAFLDGVLRPYARAIAGSAISESAISAISAIPAIPASPAFGRRGRYV